MAKRRGPKQATFAALWESHVAESGKNKGRSCLKNPDTEELKYDDAGASAEAKPDASAATDKAATAVPTKTRPSPPADPAEASDAFRDRVGGLRTDAPGVLRTLGDAVAGGAVAALKGAWRIADFLTDVLIIQVVTGRSQFAAGGDGGEVAEDDADADGRSPFARILRKMRPGTDAAVSSLRRRYGDAACALIALSAAAQAAKVPPAPATGLTVGEAGAGLSVVAAVSLAEAAGDLPGIPAEVRRRAAVAGAKLRGSASPDGGKVDRDAADAAGGKGNGDGDGNGGKHPPATPAVVLSEGERLAGKVVGLFYKFLMADDAMDALRMHGVVVTADRTTA